MKAPDRRVGLDGGAWAPHIGFMTENQILALVSSLALLAFLLFRNWRSFPREGLLWKTTLWLAIFLGVGLFYKAFGPF